MSLAKYYAHVIITQIKSQNIFRTAESSLVLSSACHFSFLLIHFSSQSYVYHHRLVLPILETDVNGITPPILLLNYF